MKKAISRVAENGARETVLVDMDEAEQAAMAATFAAGAPSIARVKAEAGRRILARYPAWKQANMTARGVELIRKGEGNWTEEEAAEADAAQAAWDWVKAVRAASDVLEAQDPIPADFASNLHWPSQNG